MLPGGWTQAESSWKRQATVFCNLKIAALMGGGSAASRHLRGLVPGSSPDAPPDAPDAHFQREAVSLRAAYFAVRTPMRYLGSKVSA